MTTKARITAEEAREAVSNYNPETDWRYHQRVARMWRIVAEELVELAEGYRQDGKSIGELKIRLETELSNRISQAESEKQSSIEEFARTARDLVTDSCFAARADAIHQHNVEQNAAMAKIRQGNEARLKEHRDAQYQKDLADAELRREGKLPVKPAYM